MDSSESQADVAPASPRMKWWGWGDEAQPPTLSAAALAAVKDALGGLHAPPRPPIALREVKLLRPALDESDLSALRRAVSEVRCDDAARVECCAGRGYLDLIRLRSGQIEGAPDAVLLPADREQLTDALRICVECSIAAVPFGGGTSVVGGLAPLRGEHRAVVALDMRRICDVSHFDRASMTVRVGAGMRVAELERRLAADGLTLGHFPQSFEQVTVGGCAATRSAGQASGGYGRFESMVLGLSLTAPAGRILLPAVPASAAGPDLRQLVVGSEGTLGVIDELMLRVRAAPASRAYEGLLFADLPSGVATLRDLAQEGSAPTIARLSDRQETSLTIAMSGGGAKSRIGLRIAGLRGYREPCLAIFGFEGSEADVRVRRRRALMLARLHGALHIGEGPGEAWRASRFQAPYLRDELLTHGVMVETLETATQWSSLEPLRVAVISAISGALDSIRTPGVVGCHISHVYESGASLYFTFIAPMLNGREEEQWRLVKRSASDAISASGGTISHHHAVGRDHAQWLEREIGPTGIESLRALKRQLDPTGIMNPGKLLPSLSGG